jgi:deferrochelatase/peroxidase EfeB
MKPVDRRAFITRSLALAGAAGAGALAQDADASGASLGTAAEQVQRVGAHQLMQRMPFDGYHQHGILDPAQPQATFVAFDSITSDRLVLAEALQVLSAKARELTAGGTFDHLEIDDPPADSGILGPYNAPDALSVTIGFGSSLFDGRFGLAKVRPLRLIEMPTFPVDQLVPAQSHGDLIVQIGANQRDTVLHTVRELVRAVRGTLQQRWSIDGFSSAHRGPTPHSSTRNLFAFRDGTANPDTSDSALMNRLIWASADEPAWAAGGTYQVVRIIRMHVEFWDRVGLTEQQTMIGRYRASGAPLGGTHEFEDPDYPSDPKGDRIPLTAHIRLANPRTAATADQRILRRGFNYDRGFDAAGQLDQGLVFSAFNQDPSRQFATIQDRLNDEPMIDYITPVGGGYFFVPPASRSATDWVGSGLFAATT